MGAQEAEEFDAFTQAPFHHVPTREHLAQNFPDLGRPEIEALVEVFELVIHLVARQMRIADRRQLHPFLADEIDDLVLREPAVLDRLVIEHGAGSDTWMVSGLTSFAYSMVF